MPRQSRGSSSAPRRPTAAPARPAAPPAQSRPMSTTAHPPAQTHQAPPQAAPQQSAGPGLFGQMASTAAGVAVGSTIGHTLGGFFSGGSSAPAEQQSVQASQSTFEQPRVCANEVSSFRTCMDENRGDLNICGWYLEQLKSCQAAASQY